MAMKTPVECVPVTDLGWGKEMMLKHYRKANVPTHAAQNNQKRQLTR